MGPVGPVGAVAGVGVVAGVVPARPVGAAGAFIPGPIGGLMPGRIGAPGAGIPAGASDTTTVPTLPGKAKSLVNVKLPVMAYSAEKRPSGGTVRGASTP